MNKELLSQLLSHHGYDCEEFIPVTTGKFNTTFLCKIQQNHKSISSSKNTIVLRIAPPDNTGVLFYEKNMMAQEPALHKVIKEKTTLPVPKIYVFDNSQELITHNFLIEEYLSGTPLSQTLISQSSQNSIMEAMGKYLRELHSNCQQNQYGYLGEHHCMEAQHDWFSAFSIMWNKLIDDIHNCGVYDHSEVSDARTALEKHDTLFNRNVPASLLHMDIWSQNILIDQDENTISGILDWDRALWGDPEIEYAVLDYCGFNTSSFWKGYGDHELLKNREGSKIRRMFYHLYEVQKYLVIWTLRRPDKTRVNNYKHYSLNIIKQLLSL
jgi:fructosamine-3-kinase